MCGRFELHTHPAALALAFGLPFAPDIHPRYNIAPMQNIPVIRNSSEGVRELAQMRWGLVPRWAKDPAIGARMINARGETIAEKSAFRTPFERHRCLIPADGFYEWQAVAGGRKQPMHVTMKDGATFAFAGLSERWLSSTGDVVDSCTIVTTAANALLRPLHERMPVIIAPDDYQRWLDNGGEPPHDLVAAYPSDAMTFQPVSTRVNTVRNDDAGLIEPVDLVAAAALPEPSRTREADLTDVDAPHAEDAPEQQDLF
jgi:putative SOS response-associated peptidase YedK